MDPAEELRYLVLGAQREGARLLAEILRPLGLTPAQAEVLAVLRDTDRPLTVREVGERLICEGGSPSRLVATVVDAGLVQRAARVGDLRAVELSLTADGRKAARRLLAAERRLHDGLAEAIGDRDMTAVIDGLRKLVAGRAAGDALARRRAG